MVTQNSLQILKASEVPIKSVTVFNNASKDSNKRAEITRIFNVSLKPGINEIQLEDIATTIVPNSISVIGQGHATILDVSLKTKEVTASERKMEKQQKLKSELKECEAKIVTEKDLYDVQNAKLAALKTLLNKYTEKKENETEFDKAVGTKIMELFGFYEKNADEINAKMRAIKERGKKLEDEVQALKAKITVLTITKATKSYISIKVDSETENDKEDAELTLVYHVTGASWIPFYDIRVDTKSNIPQVTIYYYANVEQETGEDWKNTELSLSTAQPCNNETLPKLRTTIVEFVNNIVQHNGGTFGKPHPSPFGMPQQQQMMSTGSGGLFGNAQAPQQRGALFGNPQHQQMQQQQMPQQQMPQQQMQRQQSSGSIFGSTPTPHPRTPSPPPPMKNLVTVAEKEILSTTFTVSRKSTIPSDSSKNRVTVGIKKVTANFHHECVPKKDTNAYLMATVTNTTDYPLLPGFATVYIDNSLSTSFNLKAVLPNEKFDCSLGIDKTVKIIYKPTIKSKTKLSSGVFSNYYSVSNEQKIVVKNTKKVGPICITVYEPIPKSTNERIKIRVTEPDPINEKSSVKNKHGEENGEAENETQIGPFLDENHNLMWTENIQAEKEFIIKWAVDYPIDEKVKFTEK